MWGNVKFEIDKKLLLLHKFHGFHYVLCKKKITMHILKMIENLNIVMEKNL